MRKLKFSLPTDTRAEIEEAVFVLPVLILVTFGLINLAMVGFAGLNAANAANYAARMASVAQANYAGVAVSSAEGMLSGVPVGTYTVSISGGGVPGSQVRVQVAYSVPNYIAGLAGLFGITTPASWDGSTGANFRQEGW